MLNCVDIFVQVLKHGNECNQQDFVYILQCLLCFMLSDGSYLFDIYYVQVFEC